VSLPANITGQAILNARMVGAIAHLRGWDLRDELVRNSVLITIAGGTPNAVLAEFGVTVARKSAEAAIRKLPIAIVREINKRVGFCWSRSTGQSDRSSRWQSLYRASAASLGAPLTPRSLGSSGVWQGSRSPHWRRRLMRMTLGDLLMGLLSQ